jgi:hypothetical protein
MSQRRLDMQENSRAPGAKPSPIGRGWGEGCCSIEMSHPLTLPLSPWERGLEAMTDATSNHGAPGRIGRVFRETVHV